MLRVPILHDKDDNHWYEMARNEFENFIAVAAEISKQQAPPSHVKIFVAMHVGVLEHCLEVPEDLVRKDKVEAFLQQHIQCVKNKSPHRVGVQEL